MAFFQQARPSREPFLNAPASVLWLIAVLLAAHAGRALAPAALSTEIVTQYAFIPAVYSPAALAAAGLPPVGLGDQLVRLVSYMFVHADFTHVGVNCLWLLAFGPATARRLGAVRFYVLFFLCGIIAALAHLAANWGSLVPVVGASGGISGLMAGSIRILYGSRFMVFGERPPLAPIFSRPVLFFSFIWVALNVFVGLTGFGVTEKYALVAWVAHLGGYAAGLVLIGLFDPPRMTVGQA